MCYLSYNFDWWNISVSIYYMFPCNLVTIHHTISVNINLDSIIYKSSLFYWALSQSFMSHHICKTYWNKARGKMWAFKHLAVSPLEWLFFSFESSPGNIIIEDAIISWISLLWMNFMPHHILRKNKLKKCSMHWTRFASCVRSGSYSLSFYLDVLFYVLISTVVSIFSMWVFFLYFNAWDFSQIN